MNDMYEVCYNLTMKQRSFMLLMDEEKVSGGGVPA